MVDGPRGFNSSMDLDDYIGIEIIPSTELQQKLDMLDQMQTGFKAKYQRFVSNLFTIKIKFDYPLIYSQTYDQIDMLKLTIKKPWLFNV